MYKFILLIVIGGNLRKEVLICGLKEEQDIK